MNSTEKVSSISATLNIGFERVPVYLYWGYGIYLSINQTSSAYVIRKRFVWNAVSKRF